MSLTHHPREPLETQGGTTFTFVTEGIESALEQARAAAGDRNVAIAGERLLEDVGEPTLEPVKVVASPAVTHVKYRIVR